MTVDEMRALLDQLEKTDENKREKVLQALVNASSKKPLVRQQIPNYSVKVREYLLEFLNAKLQGVRSAAFTGLAILCCSDPANAGLHYQPWWD